MTATDTFLGLLRRVLTDRDDDFPRVLLADWWEENGEPERAAYIREGIDYANWFDPHEQAPRAIDSRNRLKGLLAAWWPGAWPIPSNETPELGNGYLYLTDSLGAAALSDPGDPGKPGHRAVLHRGFVSQLICPAEIWLRHADEIYWHPEQTGPCRAAGCEEGVIGRPKRGMGPGGQWMGRMCESCDGTGRVPRECPPTAQPLERVTLTTWPDWEVEGIDAEDWAMMNRASAARLLEREGAKRWPGLTFAITPPAAS